MSLYANPYGGPLDGLWGPNQSQSVSDLFYGQLPNLAFKKYRQRQGMDDWSPFGQFAQSQFGNLYDDYSLESLNRPGDYSFSTFLEESGGLQGLQRRFRGLGPTARGESPSRFGGRVRMSGFS